MFNKYNFVIPVVWILFFCIVFIVVFIEVFVICTTILVNIFVPVSDWLLIHLWSNTFLTVINHLIINYYLHYNKPTHQ